MVLPKAWAQWIDGYKSIIGLGILVVSIICEVLGYQVSDKIFEVAYAILGIGLVDKFRKIKESVDNLKKNLEDAV